MEIEDLQAALAALGVTVPDDLAVIAEMAARRVARDTRYIELVAVEFPAETAEVEHGIEDRIVKLLPNRRQRDCEVSFNATHVRCVRRSVPGDDEEPAEFEPLDGPHKLRVHVERSRFDGTLADLPTELVDALTYAVAAQIVVHKVDITEVKTATHSVSRQVAKGQELSAEFETRYRDALPDEPPL